MFSSTPIPALSHQNLTILVAEDNQMNRLVIKKTLSVLLPNAIIFIANDGQEAVNMVKERHQSKDPYFDIIILDDNMPNLIGEEAAKQIRQYEIENRLTAALFTWSSTYLRIDPAKGEVHYFPEAIAALSTRAQGATDLKTISARVLANNKDFVSTIDALALSINKPTLPSSVDALTSSMNQLTISSDSSLTISSDSSTSHESFSLNNSSDAPPDESKHDRSPPPTSPTMTSRPR